MLKKLKLLKFKFFITLINLVIMMRAFGVNFIPEQPHLTSRAFILLDYNSGKILLEKNSEERLPPASLTKIMTMYVIGKEMYAKRLSEDDEVTISKAAWQTGGSRMFVNINSKVKVADLIKGIIIQSGNDASVAMAEHIAGSEGAFAGMMNDYAVSLGMVNSHFVNSTGLPDPNHYTTAKDLSILARATISEDPENYKIYSHKAFVYNNIQQHNRNKLLWRNNLVDGIKTGQTDDAGYCLAVSGAQDGTRLIAILLGAKSDDVRTAEANKLLTWGFRFFTSEKIYNKGTILGTARVWGGDVKTVDIGLQDNIYLSLLRNDVNKLTMDLSIPQSIRAPLQPGEQIGKYVIKLKEEVIAEYPAIVLTSVRKGHFFNRVVDRLAMYFNHKGFKS